MSNLHLPVQKCLNGAEVKDLSDIELLSVVIGSGSGGHDVFSIAADLFYANGGLRGIYKSTLNELIAFTGIGKGTAVKLLASFELGRRIVGKNARSASLNEPERVWNAVLPDIIGLDCEIFIVIVLGSKNTILSKNIITKGTVNETLIHPREVFKRAITDSGSGVIVCHNHPSGSTEPSLQDKAVTERLICSGELLGIPLVDHLIVTETGYFSLRDCGLWDT
jgi:DNA repair protein RadC